jgi:flagellar basal body-associated protein FliL
MNSFRQVKNMLIAIVVLIALTAIVAGMAGFVAKETKHQTMKSQDNYQVIIDRLKPEEKGD